MATSTGRLRGGVDDLPEGTVSCLDWFLFHVINTGVATRDWLEDPVTLLAGAFVTAYAIATVALWFLDRPYGAVKWKLASASALASAAVAMLANQVIANFVWDRGRPYTTHHGATHLLSAPSVDPSFPSDHSAAAFAIAFAVFAFRRGAGTLFLAAATLISLSRIALGMHYPSDVLAGALIGWVAALLVTRPAKVLVVRLVALVSKVSDPLLRPLWDRALRRRTLGY